jgi:hypothetical protein
MTCNHGFLLEECHFCSTNLYLEEQGWNEFDWMEEQELSSDEYNDSFWELIDSNFDYQSIIDSEFEAYDGGLDTAERL